MIKIVRAEDSRYGPSMSFRFAALPASGWAYNRNTQKTATASRAHESRRFRSTLTNQ